MQATREARRGTGLIAIAIGLALLGLLAAFVLVALDDRPAGGDVRGLVLATPSRAVTPFDRADSIARLRDGASPQPLPAFIGDRQDQIERLRRD